MHVHEYPVGTIFTRPSLDPRIGSHFGVHVGAGSIVDLQKDGATCAAVRVVDSWQFAAGYGLNVELPPNGFDEGAFMARVSAALEAQCIKYGVLGRGAAWNCESLARWLVSGRKHSSQGEIATLALAVLAVVVVLGFTTRR